MNETITSLFGEYCNLTGNPEAAAMLVLAQIQTIQQHPQLQTTASAMNVRQAAEKLGVSKETVYKLCAEHSMPHTRIRKRITISQQQLAEYLEGPNYRHLDLP